MERAKWMKTAGHGKFAGVPPNLPRPGMAHVHREPRPACGVRSRWAAQGLGLAEVAICLAIIAVLAAYAIPSYRAHLMRGYRVDAVSALYRAAHYLEQQQADGQSSSGPVSLPAGLAQTPQSGQPVYRLSVFAADADNGGYAVEASPLESGPMRADRMCGGFILDASGRRANRVEGTVVTETVAACWEGRGGAR